MKFPSPQFLVGGGKGEGALRSVNLTSLAAKLRKNETLAERKLWSRLHAKQMARAKFRRQQPIGRYIVDFICCEKRLIIELDGGQHIQQNGKDQVRDKWLMEQGYKVLRFWDNEIFEKFTGVLNCIRAKLL
jgi:very-short-patch-repair endonuclease